MTFYTMKKCKILAKKFFRHKDWNLLWHKILIKRYLQLYFFFINYWNLCICIDRMYHRRKLNGLFIFQNLFFLLNAFTKIGRHSLSAYDIFIITYLYANFYYFLFPETKNLHCYFFICMCTIICRYVISKCRISFRRFIIKEIIFVFILHI